MHGSVSGAKCGRKRSTLVRIENTEKQEMPLLSPTQTFFLRENLKLRLLSARMALLTRDEVSFRRDLKTAQEWIKRYFDIKSNESAQALGALAKARCIQHHHRPAGY